FVGVSLAMLFDGYLLSRMFDTRVFPASGAWPPGVASAEAIKSGDSGGVQARFLGLGMLVGIGGNWFGIIGFPAVPLTASSTLWSAASFPWGAGLRRHGIRPQGRLHSARLREWMAGTVSQLLARLR